MHRFTPLVVLLCALLVAVGPLACDATGDGPAGDGDPDGGPPAGDGDAAGDGDGDAAGDGDGDEGPVGDGDGDGDRDGDGDAGGPLAFSLNEENATLWARVWRDPDALGAGFAHDHVIRAGDLAATLTFDPANLAACSVSVTVQVAGLEVDEPFMREKVGLEGTVSASDRTTIKGHMTGADQLDVATYPTLSFTASSCQVDGGSVTAVGTLTIRGTPRATSWPMTFSLEGDHLQAAGHIEVSHGDFGFAPYEAFFGAVRNRDDIQLYLEVDAGASAAK